MVLHNFRHAGGEFPSRKSNCPSKPTTSRGDLNTAPSPLDDGRADYLLQLTDGTMERRFRQSRRDPRTDEAAGVGQHKGSPHLRPRHQLLRTAVTATRRYRGDGLRQ